MFLKGNRMEANEATECWLVFSCSTRFPVKMSLEMLEIYSKHFKIVNYYYSKPPSILKE